MPEKIYIFDYNDAMMIPLEGDTVYVREDAFMEKACKGIEHLLSGYIIRNFHFGDSYEMDTLIEDFKKYMEE